MKLIDIAAILRSKNAGPLYITFDIIFHNKEDMRHVYSVLKAEQIAFAYDVPVESVTIIPYEIVDSIKITFPRKIISGCVKDDDVYGCQQQMKLAQIEID